MQRQSPVARCAVVLCFGCAIALAAFEWRSPIPEPIITPEETSTLDLNPNEKGQLVNFNWAKEKWQNLERPLSSKLISKLAPKPLKQTDSSVLLTLSLSERTLEVQQPGSITTIYNVAVGQADWQTPTGEFTVLSKLENPAWQHPLTKEEIPPGPDNPLGTHWIGFWTDGQAQIGFHGTNQEDLIGEAVSHGCVRMRNQDIKTLYSQVEVGTQIIVIP